MNRKVNGKGIGTLILLVGVLATLAIGYFGGSFAVEPRSRVIYEGRAHLTTEEYSNFKEVLASHPDIEINELDVYSSPDPLVVFEVVADESNPFPYGEATRHEHPNLMLLIFVIPAAVVVLGVSLGVGISCIRGYYD